MSDAEDHIEGDVDLDQTQPTGLNANDQVSEDDRLFPDRPQNHSETLPFHTLYQDLFDPLLTNRNSANKAVSRRKVGPKAMNSQKPHEVRRAIIEAYISRWRKEVGNDFYPCMRLILPDKDRDRAMYGLKEKVLAKYFIKILKIDKNSEDGYNLLNWKKSIVAKKAGDFPGRVYEVISKRPFRVEPGSMTIAEVNEELTELSSKSKEHEQLPIIERFYRKMNPDELKWLVCIILRTMSVGATEKTFLNIWHPDAEVMFNVSSSLKRVCWQLWNHSIRLRSDVDQGVELFECFQPQLANFQPRKMNSIIARMQLTEEDPIFWIEEKLDGERMQLHLRTNVDDPKTKTVAGKEFKFWSRNAKDYTYLYGSAFDTKDSALTRHLRDAFHEGVDNLILDGEMITWDPETDKMVPFGTLKTAALEQQRNPYSSGPRPLYRIFDILYLNGTDLTRYTLRDRKKAIAQAIKPVKRRLEIHEYVEGRTWDDIESALRKVVAEASEGLVIKNPRSRYRLNDRNDDWVKVKPEYMEEFGESLDCLVIGGYYGSGKRGGFLSSFLCGLRVDDAPTNTKSPKWLSFFKVGGGLTANDYANIRHVTEGKWIEWNRHKPPSHTIALGGGEQYQREMPDMWIKPEDSVVLQAKAASVAPSDEFAVGLTLRFPRFQKLRGDKDWQSALSMEEFLEVRAMAETKRAENKEKARMSAESRKRHQRVDLRNKPLQVVGYSQKSVNEATSKAHDDATNVFQGLTIYVLTESLTLEKKTKIQLEQLIKAHQGKIIQTADVKTKDDGRPADEVICIAAKRSVKVASLVKRGNLPVLRPTWIFDCIKQAQHDVHRGIPALPLRPELGRHVFFSPEERKGLYEMEVDQYGDSYGRDTTIEELELCIKNMDDTSEPTGPDSRLEEMFSDLPGSLFRNTVIFFVSPHAERREALFQNGNKFEDALRKAKFAGAIISTSLNDSRLTHVVVQSQLADELKQIRNKLAEKKRLPRVVTPDWITDSWKEQTRLDEERYTP